MSKEAELLLNNRHFLYTYTSRAFAAEPDEAFLSFIRDGHTHAECALLDSESGQLCRIQRSIESALPVAADGVSSPPNNGRVPDAGELRSEYTKLFIGPNKLPAPPWESVYLTGESLIFQESTLAVRAAYLKEGFKAAGYPHEPDDHIATELDFMAALSERTARAFETGDKERYLGLLGAQLAFLEEHLLRWVQDFSDCLNSQKDISAFYPSFASLAAFICQRDADILKELLNGGT